MISSSEWQEERLMERAKKTRLLKVTTKTHRFFITAGSQDPHKILESD